jgi:hypothetical protein
MYIALRLRKGVSGPGKRAVRVPLGREIRRLKLGQPRYPNHICRGAGNTLRAPNLLTLKGTPRVASLARGKGREDEYRY